MNLQFVENIDDPRLEPYRHLRTTNLTRFSGRFIAESRPLVQRLLASDLQVDSILVDAKRLDEGLAWLPKNVPIYVVEHDAVAELIGFQFHRGFLACGLRPNMQVWNPQPLERDWTGVMSKTPKTWVRSCEPARLLESKILSLVQNASTRSQDAFFGFRWATHLSYVSLKQAIRAVPYLKRTRWESTP
jgi:hypothetical protein